MTPKERAELIAAKDAIIAAKDQTIIVLSDIVDDLRRQLAVAALPGAAVGAPDITPRFEPLGDPDRSLWRTDEEEHIMELSRTGTVDEEQAAAMLQAVGAMNTRVSLVQ